MQQKEKNLLEKGYISENILLVDKPIGISSFDVIRRLRKKLGIQKMGHAGTLDPLASGVMIIGCNEATKQLDEFLKLPKTYRAEILLGRSTDTGDQEGNVVDEKFVDDLSEDDVDKAVRSLIGTQTLAVPLYSAIKVQGKPLYWYARNNVTPPHIPEKDMTVTHASVLDFYMRENRTALVVVRFEVASGTYIRTLAEELGRRLGYPASLESLRRTAIDQYTLDDAVQLDEI